MESVAMDWTPGGMSGDVEDRRGSDDGGGGGGGGWGPGGGGGGIGIVGVLVLLVVSLITGRNYLGSFLAGGGGVTPHPQQAPYPQQGPQPGYRTAPGSSAPGSTGTDRDAQLISFVLDDVQKTWTVQLPDQTGKPYRHAKLVLFTNATRSGCGAARSQTGPFYCPADEKVYIDLSFWNELHHIGGSTADFAQAYVIAHELGHHVQNILGIEDKVQQLSGQNPAQRNPLSVDLELQADCFAGVWAHSGEQRGFIHASDVQDGLSAAAAVGDDHLQKMTRGTVSPESFTHGTSAQRMGWFKRGLDTGAIASCNTFKTGGELPVANSN
jgi:predicted metalloprotease